jgi:hypothetical protein
VSGEIQLYDRRDTEIADLKEQVRDLQHQLHEARQETKRAVVQADRSMSALRKQLTPFYRMLQMIFGELDAAGVEADGADVTRGAWDEWKTRLGPSCAKVIDALLLGGEMTITAICVSAKIGKATAYQATSKMGQAGILVRNGSKFSLTTWGR